jgi:phosphate-selective porin OprO/OprP
MSVKSFAAAVIATASVLSSFGQDFEKRLQKLEEEVQSLRKENQQLKAALGEGKAGLIDVKPAGKEVSLKLGGVVQAQADFLDKGDSRWGSRNDRFYLRRARLNASGSFLEDFDFKVELELAGTFGDASAIRAQLTDGFINYHRYDWANFKVGQFKTGFGYEQLFSDPRLFTIERSLANDRLTLSRQIGVQVSGDLFDKRLSYASGIFNGAGPNTSTNDNDSFEFVQRVSGIPWEGKSFGRDANWRLGANGYLSDDKSIGGMADFGFDSTPGGTLDGIFAGYRRGAGVDTQFHLGPLEFWLEYLWARFEPQNPTPKKSVEADGWYAQVGYFLLPEKLQAVVKFESFDPDRHTAGNSSDLWTFGLNYYIKDHYLKVQLDYLLFDAAGQPDNRGKILVRLHSMF